MTNRYEELKNRHQKEMNAFPLGAAFSNGQFVEMMERWGLTPDDTNKIYRVGSGCFIRKCNRAVFHEIINRQERELAEARANDKTGDGFICDMFRYELANHEYCITYDFQETFDALGLTVDEVNADERLLHGLKKARAQYLKNCKEDR